MEYVYAAMLLHSAEKNIDEDAVSAVLTAAGVDADGARVKALVASLGSVDIGEAMATAVQLRWLRPPLPPLAAVVLRRLRLRKQPQRKNPKKKTRALKAWAHSSDDSAKARCDAKPLWARA